MYTISITYTTGDSFTSYICNESIGCSFKTLRAAKDALDAIKEHHGFLKVMAGNVYLPGGGLDTSWRDNINLLGSKEWLYTDRGAHSIDKISSTVLSGQWKFYMNLKTGYGNVQKINVFWVGHFETLHRAEIQINVDNKDMVVNFDD